MRPFADASNASSSRRRDQDGYFFSFHQSNAELSQLRTDIQIDRLVLARLYPDRINSRLSSWEDSICDFESMASNQAFLNGFIDNMRRFEAYVSGVNSVDTSALTVVVR